MSPVLGKVSKVYSRAAIFFLKDIYLLPVSSSRTYGSRLISLAPIASYYRFDHKPSLPINIVLLPTSHVQMRNEHREV